MNQNDSLQNQPESESFLKSALALKGSVTPKVMKKVSFVWIFYITVPRQNQAHMKKYNANSNEKYHLIIHQ